MRAASVVDYIWLVFLSLAPFDAVLLFGSMATGVALLSWPRLILIAGICASVLSSCVKPPIIETRLLRAVAPMLAWFAWSLASVIWTKSTDGFSRYVLFLLFELAVFYETARLVANRGALQVLYFVPLLVSLAAGGLELWGGVRLDAYRQHEFPYSLVGPFVNPSYFSFWLGLYIPGLFVYAAGDNKRNRNGARILLPIAIWMSVRTGARTGLVGLVAGTLVVVGLYITRRRGFVAAGMVAAMAVVVVYGMTRTPVAQAIPVVISNKLGTVPTMVEAGMVAWNESSRGYTFNLGIRAMQQAPLVGHGAGATEEILATDANAVTLGNVNAHNWWLELGLNGGMIGLMLFLGAYVTTMVGVFRYSRARKGIDIPSTAVLAGLMTFPAMSVGPSSLLTNAALWLFLGFGAGIAAQNEASSRR